MPQSGGATGPPGHPSRGHGHTRKDFSRKALPVARRSTYGHNPAAFSGTAWAVQDKSFIAADLRLPGDLAKPLGQVALPAPIGLKVSHFLPFGKDGPVSRRVGGRAFHEEQRSSNAR